MESITFRKYPVNADPVTVESIVRSTGFFREDEVTVAVELVEERLSKGMESGPA